MKLSNIIKESPIPDDWDSSLYTKKTSFAMKLKYARARAKTIGTGSSRVAFEIEYQGRPTILKIAKNIKGIRQNEYEADILKDQYVQNIGIAIPIIDSDPNEDNPAWIHTEKAGKIKIQQFKSFMEGMSPLELTSFLKWASGKHNTPPSRFTRDEASSIIDNNEIIANLATFVGSYEIEIMDFAALRNWGVYNNKPVIIDVGGSSEIIRTYYMG